MHAHKAVFRTAGITSSLGMVGDGVDGTEMATDAPDFTGEHGMEEAGLELASAGGGRGDVQGFLTAGHDDLVADGGDGCRVHRTFRLKILEDFERGGLEYTGGVVTGGGDEEGAVGRHLEVFDGVRVLAGFGRLLSRLRVPLTNGAVVMAGDQIVVAV